MKKANYILAVLMIAVFVISVSSCKKYDPEPDTIYNLKIENKTDQAYDIFMKNNASNLDFIKQGHVASQSTIEIKDLTVDYHYTLRAVIPGNSIDDYYVEEKFTSANGSDDYIIKINP